MGQDPFNIASTGEPTPPRTEPRRPKVPDPVKQRKCGKDSTREELCEESARCENDCDDMFSGRAEKTCLKLPTRLVYDFTELLEFTEDGDIDEIDSEVLECLLDIDDKEFIDAVEKMNRDAEEFLAGIADDEDLANVFQDEDDNSDILKALLKEATGKNDIEAQLREDIDDGKTFLQLAAEGAEDAWDWLEDYVEEEYPNRDPIVTYCDVIVNGGSKSLRDSDLDDLLDTDPFEDEYEDEVERDGYSYKATGTKNFKNWCNVVKLAPNLPTPCPESGASLPTNKRVRIETTPAGPSNRHQFYLQRNYCEVSSGSQSVTTHNDWTASNSNSFRGSNTHRDYILALSDDQIGSKYGWIIIINDNLDYDSDKKYYLYVGNTRYNLRDPDHRPYPETCREVTSSNRKTLIRWEGFIDSDSERFFGTGPHDVWLASDEGGDNCEYYK